MGAYYNENDPFKAAELRELIRANLIAPGEVDERSIEDVEAADLKGFTQCHFFAGVGVWSYALRLAGWSDSRPVWTGSCPCPSFSAAGKGEGFEDARHLWPYWFELIRKRRPSAIFGEQVESAIGFGWLDLVQTDLEAEAYAVGKAVLGACSVGAPHRRQRLYFVADSADARRDDSGQHGSRRSLLPARSEQCGNAVSGSESLHAQRWPINVDGENGRHGQNNGRSQTHSIVGAHGEVFERADSNGGNSGTERLQRSRQHGLRAEDGRGFRFERDNQRAEVSDGGNTEIDRRERKSIPTDGESAHRTQEASQSGDCADASSLRRDERRPGSGPSVQGQRSERTETQSRPGNAGELPGRPEGLCSASDGGDTSQRGLRMRGGASGNSGRASLASESIDSLNSEQSRLEGHFGDVREWRGSGWLDPITARSVAEAGATRGFWADCDWWFGRDEKYRPIGTGLFPLVNGAPARVGRLRGYGDAIVAQVAQAFIEACIGEDK